MSVEIDMSGKTALVTGAAQGIGYKTASLIAEAGGRVVIADLNGDAAEEAAKKLSGEGHEVAAATVDIREPEQAKAAVAVAVEKFGSLDVLVNNAAAWTVKYFKKQDLDDYNLDIGVTLIGTMNMCSAGFEPLSEGDGGAVVNLISDAGRVGESGLVGYSAAKAGVVGFTKAFAKEGARYGVRCNGVSPGTTHTASADQILEGWGGEDKIKHLYPLGRLGVPEDIGNAILFLASPMTSWVTGQILSVNGGYSMPD
jgi:NAD(P)-dependent dehydrogenase (short-subunit alcohol dehydrogenase family)